MRFALPSSASISQLSAAVKAAPQPTAHAQLPAGKAALLGALLGMHKGYGCHTVAFLANQAPRYVGMRAVSIDGYQGERCASHAVSGHPKACL